MPASFLFYDLETFGIDPRSSRIAQFAAIRTDEALNEIEAPHDFMLRPANDLLPSPEASLVTGITPQAALEAGIREADGFARINEAMTQPRTCSVGYNSLRFDDEFVRYGLFRNFHDAYEREWRGGNSRWDLLDVMRLMYALRPDGMVWPKREDGAVSFKLEHLAEANQVRLGDAHEALSDVRALIGIARRMRAAQPRLWDYALRLRDKRFAAGLLDTVAMAPVLHVSQRYPATRLCAAAVLPLTRHPLIDNRIIVLDLDGEPDALFELDADAIAARLYTPREQLAEGETRVPLKEVHLNRCPALAAWHHLTHRDLERLRIDEAKVEARAARIREAGPELAEKVRQVFARPREHGPADVDASLYDGFIGDADKRRMAEVRGTAPEALGLRDFGFQDPRLPELLLRYRARNWPELLDEASLAQWNRYRRQRLLSDPESPLSLASYFSGIGRLRIQYADDGDKLDLLDRLDQWGRSIEDELTA